MPWEKMLGASGYHGAGGGHVSTTGTVCGVSIQQSPAGCPGVPKEGAKYFARMTYYSRTWYFDGFPGDMRVEINLLRAACPQAGI